MKRHILVLILLFISLLVSLYFYNDFLAKDISTIPQCHGSDSLRTYVSEFEKMINAHDSVLQISENKVEKKYGREIASFVTLFSREFTGVLVAVDMPYSSPPLNFTGYRFTSTDWREYWARVLSKTLNSDFSYKILYEAIRPSILKKWNDMSFHKKVFVLDALNAAVIYLDSANLALEKRYYKNEINESADFLIFSNSDFLDKDYHYYPYGSPYYKRKLTPLPDIITNPFRPVEVFCYRRVMEDGANPSVLRKCISLLLTDLTLPNSGTFKFENSKYSETVHFKDGKKTGIWEYKESTLEHRGRFHQISEFDADRPTGRWTIRGFQPDETETDIFETTVDYFSDRCEIRYREKLNFEYTIKVIINTSEEPSISVVESRSTYPQSINFPKITNVKISKQVLNRPLFNFRVAAGTNYTFY